MKRLIALSVTVSLLSSIGFVYAEREDAPYVSGSIGTTILGVRRDADTSPVSADGDNHTLIFDDFGALKVNLQSADVAIGGGTEYTEGDTDSTITGGAILWEDTSNTLVVPSASKPLPVALPNSTNTDGSATGTTGLLMMGQDGTNAQTLLTSSSGRLSVDVNAIPLATGAATAAKQPALGTAGSASADVITVQGISGGTALPTSISSLVPGTGANSLGKAIGNVVGATDTVVGQGVQRDDALSTLSDADGDWVIQRVDSVGALWVRLSQVAETRTRLITATCSTITRPAATDAYAAGDAVSNSTTDGSVTASSCTVSDTNDMPVTLERLRVHSTDTGVAGKSFRAWFYQSDPTASSGIVGADNEAFSTKKGTFIGTMSGVFRTFSDGSVAVLVPDEGSRITSLPTSGAATVFYLLETLDAFTPSANNTTFISTAEGIQGHD